jgi:cytosine deaminase
MYIHTYNSARRLIENEISFGTTLLRTHVEVDPIVGMKGVEAILSIREEYKSALTIQVAVFAQEGITNQPGQVELYDIYFLIFLSIFILSLSLD